LTQGSVKIREKRFLPRRKNHGKYRRRETSKIIGLKNREK